MTQSLVSPAAQAPNNAANAAQLLRIDDVDGALVGGASLKAQDFLAILGAYGTRTVEPVSVGV